jgi:hypothetical protein
LGGKEIPTQTSQKFNLQEVQSPSQSEGSTMKRRLNRLITSIRRRVHYLTRSTTETISEEIAEVIDKTIVSPEIEAVVIQAVERTILSLVRQYWRLLAIAFIGLLLLQSIILGFMLRGVLTVMK